MKHKNLHNIKSLGFKTPDDYFESFDAILLSKLEAKDQLKDTKASGFNVPNNYFKTLDDTILKTIENKKETKVISLFSWKKVGYTAAIAASLILMFNVFYSGPERLTFEGLETASIENHLTEEDYSSYELASLLTEEELNSDSFINTTLSESSLEDYLLEHTSIEDLLIDIDL